MDRGESFRCWNGALGQASMTVVISRWHGRGHWLSVTAASGHIHLQLFPNISSHLDSLHLKKKKTPEGIKQARQS